MKAKIEPRNVWESPDGAKDNPRGSSSSLLSVARFRPVSEIERVSGKQEWCGPEQAICSFPRENTVTILDGTDQVQFSLSRVFPPEASQVDVYDLIGKPLIADVLDGYNGTIFAYGQTGSGKTYTMAGPDMRDEELRGIVPRAATQLFSAMDSADSEVEFAVKCSVLEIYKEKVLDLLDVTQANLKIKESVEKGIFVEGASAVVGTRQYVVSDQELLEVLELGASNRSVAVTRMNKASSRSHEIVQIEVSQRLSSGHEKRGLLNLIDLAGSEKASAVAGLTENFEEMKKINLSLSALGKVIHSLVTGTEHVPYRDSKLTRLLQESLGGNFKTSLIVTCSPHPKNVEETLSSLRFGERAGALKTKVRRNIKESPDAVILRLQEELLRCQSELRALKSSPDGSAPILTPQWGGSEDSVPLKEIPLPEQLVAEQRKVVKLKRENEELRSQVEALEEKVEKRRTRVGELERKLVELSEGGYTALFNYSECVRKNEELEARVEMLRKQNKMLIDQVQRLELQLNSRGDVSPSARTAEFVEHSIDETEIFAASPAERSPSPSLCHREFPLDLQRLTDNCPYTAYARAEMETPDQRGDAVTFLLKNQLIQAAFINAGMSQAYQALEWRLKLLETKLDLSEKTNLRLTEDIKRQAELVRLLQTACSHMRPGRDSATPVRKASFVRRLGKSSQKVLTALRSSPQRDGIPLQSPSPVDFRPGTSLEGRLNSNTASYVDLDEAGTRYRTVRNSLDVKETYNAQLLDLLAAKSAEVTMYVSVIQDMEKMVFTAHKLERAKWVDYINHYRANCEAELLRRQTEITNLNKVLAYWVERYTEMQNTMVGAIDTSWKFEHSLETGLRGEEDGRNKSWLSSENSRDGVSFAAVEMEALGRSRGDMSPISPEDD